MGPCVRERRARSSVEPHAPSRRSLYKLDGTSRSTGKEKAEAPAASGCGSKKNKGKAKAEDAKPAKRAKPAPPTAARNLPPRAAPHGTTPLAPTILLDGTPTPPPADWAHKRHAESAAKRLVGADVARLAGSVTLRLHVRGEEKARAKTVTSLRAKVEPTHKSVPRSAAVLNWSPVGAPTPRLSLTPAYRRGYDMQAGRRVLP